MADATVKKVSLEHVFSVTYAYLSVKVDYCQVACAWFYGFGEFVNRCF